MFKELNNHGNHGDGSDGFFECITNYETEKTVPVAQKPD
ncbi:hypothetical protein F4694_005282 [Bacillus niacini]|uniref:Uncharacterized protein n=1 Tax=Neobacillus niacini TaxID=86668 RepID=A0A852TN48_9BACI|nr:hypothetical protein [Neobacillus niacini]